ncbi:hypothetical protein EDD11_003781 [Mortierella claussenii]|nr:hypothetical protein EDD11_003781 [Mortierella claussenii]
MHDDSRETELASAELSLLDESTVVECPECKRIQEPSGPLRVNSFRPAKFVERIIKDQRMRCLTTTARSCQWIGTMADMDQHLRVCGFAIEMLCPHHVFGCRFIASLLDVKAHIRYCPFSPPDGSEATTSAAPTAANSPRQRPHVAPPSPPRSSPPLDPNDDAYDETDKTARSQYPPPKDAFHTPSMNSFTEGQLRQFRELYQDQAIEAEEDGFEQDEFLERLGDLDMTDISFSPVHTPLPTRKIVGTPAQIDRNHVLQEQRQPLMPASVLVRRRRIIVEEESDQSITDGQGRSAITDDADTAMTEPRTPVRTCSEHMADDHQQQRWEEQGVRINRGLTDEGHPAMDMTTPSPAPRRSIFGHSPPSSPPAGEQGTIAASAVSTLDPPLGLDRDLQMINSDQFMCGQQEFQGREQEQLDGQEQQGEQHHQKEEHQPRTTQRRSAPENLVDEPESCGKRRMLEFHGPWRWEITRTTKTQQPASQTGSVITLADISAVDSPVVSSFMSSIVVPQSPSSLRLGPASSPSAASRFIARATNLQFYVTEHSYLPLLVHQPRYLRPRRKKILQERERARLMTPIVRVGSSGADQKPDDALTPNITSPENSFQ